MSSQSTKEEALSLDPRAQPALEFFLSLVTASKARPFRRKHSYPSPPSLYPISSFLFICPFFPFHHNMLKSSKTFPLSLSLPN